MELLELPGWAALKAPAYSRWEEVKNKTLAAPIEGVSDPATALTASRRLVRYIPDKQDDWASPELTLKRGWGDCEDFCILQRAMLLKAGYTKPIWMVVAYDLLVRQDHALLVTDNQVLDCRVRRPIILYNLRDYRPIYAFSSDQTLTFGKRRDG